MLNLNAPINVIVADDHLLFREGFKTVFKKRKEINIIGEAANGKELFRLVERYLPHVVVTDITMPELNGIEASRLIKKFFPQTGIIGLSMFNNYEYIYRMVKAGANSYLLKDASVAEITKAIKIAHQGDYYFHSTFSDDSPIVEKDIERQPHFSQREIEILYLIFKEYTSKQIALQLHLSERTIEDHRHHIQQKMGTKNMIGMLIFALKHHIVELEQL